MDTGKTEREVNMREILFRAKRVDNGEWVEGNLITNERDESKAYIGYIFDVRNGMIKDFDIVEVIPETICQYTGLLDKSGRRIWENDIVKCNRRKGHDFFKVVWRKKYADFGVEPIGFGAQYPFGQGEDNKDIYGHHYEVIGNVFDSSELLNED